MMKHHKLNEVPVEQVTDLFSRQFFTGEKITIAFLTIKAGCAVPTHSHESEQFSYIISGALHFKIGGEEITVRAGEMMEIPSNLPHSAVALDAAITHLNAPIVCEYLPGEEYTVDCFSDREHGLLFAGARVRRRTRNGISVNTAPVASRSAVAPK